MLHSELPREGPGEPADVVWAAEIAGLPSDARILDTACGPGGDIPALRSVAPAGRIDAVDVHAPFVDVVKRTYAHDPNLTAWTGDMLDAAGPYDLIWCAGAVYFVGVEAALEAWRPALAPGGAVAFSEPVLLSDTPSPAVQDFWQGESDPCDTAGIAAQVRSAHYRTLGTRVLSPTAWEAYYQPMEARIATLRPGASDALSATLDEAALEIANYRRAAGETSYLLTVAVPD